MKQEFIRFGLPGLGRMTAVFQILGAAGLLAGFRFPILLVLASGGLALMMLVGVAVRVKVKDSLWVSIPALFFLMLNSTIFILAIRRLP